MSSIITKQLIINSLRIPGVIQDEIKSYIFVHIDYAISRKRKNELITGLRICLKYHPWDDNEGLWGLSYGFELIVKCETCRSCGGYVLVEMINRYTTSHRAHIYTIAPRAICSCPALVDFEN
jgi:hypothetical protein